MSNLVATAFQFVAPVVVGRLAGALGLSTALVERGLQDIVPTLFAGALRQSATASGAQGLVAALGKAEPDLAVGAVLEAVPARREDAVEAVDGGAVWELLGGRGNAEGVLKMLSASLGFSSGTTSALASFAAPLVLGTIGKAVGGNPAPDAVQALLAGQRDAILSMLPPGIAALLGFDGPEPQLPWGSEGLPAASAPPPPTTTGGSGWSLLLGALALLGLFYALSQCSGEEAAERTPTAPAAGRPATETVSLPGGSSVSVASGSIGYRLAAFLQSRDPPPRSFAFDNLTFATGSDRLTPESGQTVSTIAAILKAYPGAEAAIDGYTDNRGDPTLNRALSEDRARSVARALVAGGVDAGRLLARGLGDAGPIADNATEEGRVKNRRTELTITKK